VGEELRGGIGIACWVVSLSSVLFFSTAKRKVPKESAALSQSLRGLRDSSTLLSKAIFSGMALVFCLWRAVLWLCIVVLALGYFVAATATSTPKKGSITGWSSALVWADV
jgi:hypothetical protein